MKTNNNNAMYRYSCQLCLRQINKTHYQISVVITQSATQLMSKLLLYWHVNDKRPELMSNYFVNKKKIKRILLFGFEMRQVWAMDRFIETDRVDRKRAKHRISQLVGIWYFHLRYSWISATQAALQSALEFVHWIQFFFTSFFRQFYFFSTTFSILFFSNSIFCFNSIFFYLKI